MIVGDDLPINSKRQMAAALPAAVITRSLPRKAAPGREHSSADSETWHSRQTTGERQESDW